MSLEIIKPARPIDLPRDKPQVDRTEHANLDRRPGALLHPRARGWDQRDTSARGWEHYAKVGGWR